MAINKDTYLEAEKAIIGVLQTLNDDRYLKKTDAQAGYLGINDKASVAGGADSLTSSRNIITDLASTVAGSFNGTSSIQAGVTGILPTTKGGTGNANGTIAKLTTARSLKVSLSSTNAPTFDGSANVTTIGVGGTLPVSCGGTGATTAAAARNNLGLGNTTGALPVANGGTGNTIGAAQQFVSLVSDSNSTFRNVWFGANASSLKAAYDADFQYNPSTNILNVQNINGTSITISGGLTSSGTIKGAAVSVSGGVTSLGTLTGAAASLGTGGVITMGTLKGAAASVSGGVNAVGSVTGAGLSVSGGLLGSSVSVSSDISAVNINATNLNVTNLVLSSTESEVDNCLWIQWS